jgi:hypothetical protein
MDAGAPLPTIRTDGDRLFLAYLRREPAASGVVIRFDGVARYYLGAPSDERLHEHPLYSAGLTYYAFHEVRDAEHVSGGKKHWVVTFHDETFEIVADFATIVAELIEGEDTRAMLAQTG